MTIIVILVVIISTYVVVIIVLEIINTCRELHVAWKSIPFVHYSMTEEVTSLLTNVSRLGEVKSGYCNVIWSQYLPESCSVIVVGTGDFEEGGDRQIINLMQDLVGLDHVTSDSSFLQSGETYLTKLVLVRSIEARYPPHSPSLDSLQHIYILLKMRGPALHRVLEMTKDINPVKFDEVHLIPVDKGSGNLS